jgi:hypothetical protein
MGPDGVPGVCRTARTFERAMVGTRLTAEQSSIPQSTHECLISQLRSVLEVCLFLRAKDEISMARKVGQIVARGDRRWLVRVYLGRDDETHKRSYHNRTIRGPMREAQAYLTKKLRERDLGRDPEVAKITLNEYLDRWLEIAVRPKVREKTYQDYDGILRRYVRPNLGERVLAGMRPLELQTMYQQMGERGLSVRTVRYTHVVLKSAMQRALQWRLLLENPADGVKVPQQPRNEMRALTIDQARGHYSMSHSRRSMVQYSRLRSQPACARTNTWALSDKT